MWYVIQVRGGYEERIRRQCEKVIPQGALERSFIPHYEEKRKIRGQWMLRKRVLFPGYVFVVSQDVGQLYTDLWSVVGLSKLLRTGLEFIPLTAEEQALLLELGGEEQLVAMSEGILENGQARIYAGPLKGKEGWIRKIDRHKRKAWIELEMFGRPQQVEVGLEIVGKIG